MSKSFRKFLSPLAYARKAVITLGLLPVMIFVACNNGRHQQPVTVAVRDTTITVTNAFTPKFLDSLTLDNYLKNESVHDSIARQLRVFYTQRNYEYAWFTDSGFAEYSVGFGEMLNNYIAYSRDSSMYNGQVQSMIDSFANNPQASRPDSETLKTELLLSTQFFRYAHQLYVGRSELNQEKLGWFIPKKKTDPVAVLDSIVKFRGFIKRNALAGLGTLLTGATVQPLTASPNQPDSPTGAKIGTRTLEQLRNEYKAALFNRFLPNMEQLVIDKQYGGFMCDIDIETRRLRSTAKSAWYEGRGIWTYSYLYNNFGKDPRHLEVARKSKDFIMKHEPKDKRFWNSAYTREGKPTSGPGDIYCNLFIAEGLAEFAQASGESSYRDLAKKIVFSALERYDDPGYAYPITYGPEGAPDIKGPRVLGHWMVFLRGATQFLAQGADPEMEKLAARCVDAILDHHLNRNYQLLNEGLNHDMSLPGNAWSQFAYLGHGIETLWMVMAEGIRKKDRLVYNKAAEAFKRHCAVASDAVYGGFFRALDHVDRFFFKTDKVLWLQEEVLNGTLMLLEHADESWAADLFDKTYAYVQQTYVHPEYAFVVESGERSMKNYIKNRAEHYHHPRHLMQNLLALERMIKRNGKPTSMWNF